jgi:glutamate transport system substrate-binding protein
VTSHPRRLFGGAAVALVAVLLAACSSPGSIPAAPVVSGGGGSLTIGIPFDEPGIGFKAGSTYTGFDVETAKYVAGQLGVTPTNITWREANPSQRENLLEDGTVDMVFATYSITAARDQKVDFAGPYFVAHQDLLIRRNDVGITGPEALDGRRLCSVTGTTSAAYIKEHYLGRIQLQEFGKYSECVDALVAGQIDAVTTDDVILAGYAAQPQYKGILKVVGKGFTDERYGVGLKNNDPAMVAKVNAALKKYIDDGTWRTVLDNTVGPSGYAIPNPPTPGT